MKTNRHAKMIELVRQYPIETQEELAEHLAACGFTVTQATISRDIHQLRLIKVAGPDGRQQYALAGEGPKGSDRLIRLFKDCVTSMACAQNILVIKTLNGTAMGVAAALDAMGNPEIVGTIAGDDTIFCALKSEKTADSLLRKLSRV
jgi:transcriptional regulator of arginine metabolism